MLFYVNIISCSTPLLARKLVTVKKAALTAYLVVREGLKAFADPEPHGHTKPRHGRCTQCGHRIPTYPGERVRETRSLPLRGKLYEVIGRALAIRHGILATA